MNMPTSGAPTARNRGSKSCRVLLWPGRFRSDYLNRISLILFFRVPQIHKEFHCGRTVPGIVIVAESENFQDFGVACQRLEYIHPIFQVARSEEHTSELQSLTNL